MLNQIICILLAILGIALQISSALILKQARKVDEKICEDKSLSDEEFRRIRDEKVYKPEKLVMYLYYFGVLLIIPNIIYSLHIIIS
jgi:hypothetical protein